MADEETNNAESLALAALVWVLQNEARAQRMLALTGLTPEQLRADASEHSLLVAVLSFIEAHEADLIECARDIETSPLALVAARRRLEV